MDTVATTLVAPDAGSLTFEQGCAMVVGQSVGTAATTALAALGGGIAARRTAFGHIIFSVVIGVLGILFLGPLVAAADRVGALLHNPDGVLALAAFSTVFKLAGIATFYPWLDRFAQFIVRISGTGTDTAVSRLEPIVAQTGGPIALEAAWRATLQVAESSVDAIRRRLGGESVTYASQAQTIQQIDHAWRLTESLQTAAAHDRSDVVGSNQIEMPTTRPRPDRPGPVTRAA